MKRIIAFLLLAVMCVSMLAGCGGTEDTTLADAEVLLNSLYKPANGSKTKADFDVVAQVKVAGGTATVTVTWTVDNDNIKIKESSKAGYYTVDLPDENKTETKYTLTATLKNEAGETKEIKYDRILMVYEKAGTDIVDKPDAEKVYKLYLYQATFKKNIYMTAEADGGRYLKGNEDPTKGLDFTMEEVEGGYKFKTTINGAAKYLSVTLNENSESVLGFDDNGSVFAYEAARNCWLTSVSGGKYVIGTHGTYETFSASEERHITAQNSGVSQFPALLKEKEVAESEGVKKDDVTIYNTAAEILTAAYKLEGGQYLSGGHKYTLTGVVSTIDTPWDDGYKNISVTIIVDGMTDKPIQLFRLSGEGAKDLKVGDTVTATGPIMMYAKESGNILEMEKAVMGDGSNNGGENTPSVTIGAVTPVPGTAYKFYMNQTANGKVLFLTGEMNGYYMATTEDASAAADVYVEDAGEGKFYVYYMVGTAKKYLNMAKSDTHNNAVFGDTAVTSYTYNTELKTMVGALEGTDLAFGTHGTYSTFGLEAISGSDIYVAHFGIPGQGDDGEIGGDNEGGENTPVTLPEPGANASAAEIVAYAYSLAQGAKSTNTHTLTGVIISVDNAFNSQYSNVTVTIVVGGDTEHPIQCFRMKGTGADTIKVGDTITATGYLTNYNGKIKFDANCTLDSVVAGEGGDNTDPTPSTEPATDAPIAEILAFAYGLEQGATSATAYTLTGVITRVTGAYNAEYGNVTVTIVINGDEEHPISCYRLKGEGADVLAAGYTVTVTGNFNNYNGNIQLAQGCTIVSYVEGEPPAAEYDASISFASADKRTEFSTEKQVWVDNGITVTNLKAGSTSNVADYAGPARFYKSTSLTIACEGMTKIEIICDLSKPIDAMDGLTIDGVASCTVDGDTVTIILSAAADSITINEVPSQIRVSQINIYKD